MINVPRFHASSPTPAPTAQSPKGSSRRGTRLQRGRGAACQYQCQVAALRPILCRYSTPPAPPPGRSRRAVGLTALLTVRTAAPNPSTQYSVHDTGCEPDARCPVRLSADHARTRTYILPRNALGTSCFVDGVVETITVRVLGTWCHALPSLILLGSLSERRLARWSLPSMHGSPAAHH